MKRSLFLLLIVTVFVGTIANGPGSPALAVGSEIVDRGLVEGNGPPFAENEIVVRFRDRASPAAINALNAAHGATVAKAQPRSGLQRLQLPENANLQAVLAAYQRSPIVEEAALNYTVRLFEFPNDPNYPYQWHLHDTVGGMWAESAWSESTTHGSGVTVAVIDTGVAYEDYVRQQSGFFFAPTFTFKQAPDLSGTTFVHPWNFIYDDEHANDDHGHGTHVAGTVSQDTNDGYGVAGVAFNSTIMPIKVLDYSGSGSGDDLVEAIHYAVDNGAHIINMSLGFPNTGEEDADGNVCTEVAGLSTALDHAYDNDVVVVAAAGNDGGIVSCPAAYPTVISVGATDFLGEVTNYSNRGDRLDLTAPGGDPNVDQSGDGFSDGVLQETYCSPGSYIILVGGNFDEFCSVFMSGTSMAAPHVAGTAALLLGENGSLTPDQVRDILTSTARERGTPGWNPEYGWGLLDAYTAVQAVGSIEPELAGAIAGTVTEAGTNAPIEGVLVAVVETGLSAETDSQGAYSIEDLSPDTYEVTASAEGYVSATKTVTVEDGQTADADFALDAVQPETGTVNGTVTDADSGQAIAGATIELNGTETTTDSLGEYSIEDVSPGTYTVTARAEGYVSTTKTVAVEGGETAIADFSLNPDLVLGTLTGTVSDSGTGSGIAGASVFVQGDGFSTSTSTDSSGTYTINDIPVGTYTVTASADDYESESVETAIAEGDNTLNFNLDPVDVGTVRVASIEYSTRGGRLNDRHLEVTVSVVDGEDAPVADATVSIDLSRNGDDHRSFNGTTGNDGTVRFTVNNAPDGCYTAEVTGVSAGELTWDGSTPSNAFGKGQSCPAALVE